MVTAEINIYQNDETGKLLMSGEVFFVKCNYSTFRNEFNKAVFTRFSDIDNSERWITTDDKVIYFTF